MRKKRVGFVTSALFIRTGFTTSARALIASLYKTDKYELFHLNQGIADNHPEFQRYPWKNVGALKNFDQHRFNTDGGYQRLVSYGNLAVQDFITENKLDALIHVEDIWSADNNFYINAKWFPHFKDNFLHWTTADSVPILPTLKEQAEKAPHVWVWASFATNAMHSENKEKYGHVRYVPGCLDSNEYVPITPGEKATLRREFNIPDDCFVFLFLGRNQLRKLFPCCLEALAAFKVKYPQYKNKAKLYFHCSWSEAAGWPLERLIKDFGLEKDDVLTTYYCRQCGRWETKPFIGEDQDCRYCSTQKAQITAGIGSSVTNKDLSKIYGLSDGCLSVFTSGGLEMHSIQSLLCKQPLLCTEYSCGEDFVKNDFVFRLDGMYTFERETGFKKHAPNLNTIVEFFKTIIELEPSKRNEITNKGREWAINTFDYKTISKVIEEWIDSRPEVTWDYKVDDSVDIKNPHAVIPHITSDSEWIIRLYKDILNMTVDEHDSGYKTWMASLANKTSRADIEAYFRKVAEDENNKNKKITLNEVIDNNGRPTMLLVAPESIGDLFYISCLFESFKNSYPDHDIYLATKPEYFELFDCNPNIYKVIPYIPIMDSEIQMTGQGDNKGFFDRYCNITAPTQKFLNYLTNNNLSLFK